ncbi:hypothetical protein AN203_09620 [Escherichia coli]|nr:hypothetical protein AN205_09875 [Escherichia coli]AYO70973.1 hypothetical protein EAS44_01860 [Escherichia coli DSM 30083 = JCM 1649 = ATCC 11775]EFW6887630.1 hypothetical protein [Shigella sonnei]KIE83629.1 hypothetical protein SC80_04830 [Escherichia coli RS218]KIO39990.1 hypothetical protein SU67_14865 [Escherichia coli O139:H28 str. E24377A]HAJ6413479.1 hypothetical protein [Escherichia coli HVH 54 (4-2723514)]
MLFIFDIGFINSFNQYISTDYNYTFLLFCVMMLPLLAFYRLVYIFWAGMMPAFFMPSLMCARSRQPFSATIIDTPYLFNQLITY